MLSLWKYASNTQNVYSVYIKRHFTISETETEVWRQDHPACSTAPSKHVLETGIESIFLKSSYGISLGLSVSEHTSQYAAENGI